ncbi:MAG: protein kinase [Rhodothermaceae bacterium]|nr:protein kinase [Rhodothermaceae bacterium]
MQLREGTLVGHYRLLERLGEGGMGVVYRALDVTLDRHAALKFLPEQLGEDEAARERLLVEARAAAALDHPNICTIYEVGETETGRVFIAMACYDGQSLRQRLQEGGVSLGEAQDLAVQIACGLAAAHEQNIVHRDIKPSNIMITEAGVAKLLDFGIAKVDGVALTRTGTSVGTLEYMAPEQAHGQADARSDLWALGVLFYEMLAGHRPFKSTYEGALLFDLLYTEPDFEALKLRGVSPRLIAVVQHCLAKDPNARYATAEALLADLEQNEQGESDPAPAEEPPVAQRPPEPSGPALAATPSTVPPPIVPVPGSGVTAPDPAGSRRRLRVPLYVPAAMAAVLTIALSWMLIASRASGDDVAQSGGHFSIGTVPAGASVYLGDSLLGVTPLEEAHIPPGTVVLTLRKPGYASLDTTFVVEPGVAHQWVLALSEAAPADITEITEEDTEQADLVAQAEPRESEPSVQPATRPPPVQSPSGPSGRPDPLPPAQPTAAPATLVLRAVGGSVSVAGQSGSGTARLSVAAGTHTVTFRHPSYGQHQERVQVAPGETKTLTCYFEGQIRVSARLEGGGGPAPFGAVWINGQNTGQFTPTTLTRGPGTYRISLRRDGYNTPDGVQTVTIAPSLSPISRSLSFRLAPRD